MSMSHLPLVTTPAEERAPLAELDRLLAAESAPVALRLAPGERVVALPPTVTPLLQTLMHVLARGDAAAVTSVPAVLTIPRAADMLHVSRPAVVRLLDDGVISAIHEGDQRRVRLDDLLAYRARRPRPWSRW